MTLKLTPIHRESERKMSMLAEPKKKKKWILNPRTTEWSKDQNKFGQKMLEKMGWTPGKGLGAKEQGITEAISLSFKDDTKGLGANTQKEEWIEQQENFDKLLRKLSGNDDSDAGRPQSLEEKSKSTRTRVHYHKFTRGKDLSKYSEKDLSCIFGGMAPITNESTRPHEGQFESVDEESSETVKRKKKRTKERGVKKKNLKYVDS